MSSNQQIITILPSDAFDRAVIAVIPLFIDVSIIPLEPAQLTQKPKLPRHALLILNQSQLPHLAILRCQGFAGAVLILTTNPYANLLQKHRILRWGQGSHAVFTAPYALPELLQAIDRLVPLEPENLKMLQTELTAPQRWFKTRVIPTLNRLPDPQALTQIANIITELRAKTPVACHASIEIAGETAQIQQHFRQAIDRIQTAPNDDTILHLRQIFDRWRDIVLSGGEGLGTF